MQPGKKNREKERIMLLEIINKSVPPVVQDSIKSTIAEMEKNTNIIVHKHETEDTNAEFRRNCCSDYESKTGCSG
jgi:hypothetical protein